VRERKSKLIFLSATLVIFATLIFWGCRTHTSVDSPHPDIIRLHIRANSNNRRDQEVKLLVRDAVLAFLEDELAAKQSVDAAMRHIRSRLSRIESITDGILTREGVRYISAARFDVTHFPRITYESGTLAAGYYNALIITLGASGGSNWWCVIYPPLCYVPSNVQGGEGFRYRSFIWDRIGSR